MIIDGQEIPIKTFRAKEKLNHAIATVTTTAVIVTAVFSVAYLLENPIFLEQKDQVVAVHSVPEPTPQFHYNIKEGSTIYASADDTVSKTNSLEANKWLANYPIDIYDTLTNKRLNLSYEELCDEATLKKYDKERYSIIIGQDEIDGYANIEDVLSPQKTKKRIK